MINMEIWNKAYNQDIKEMKESLKENEVVLTIPVKIRFDENGVIMMNRTGSTLDEYRGEIQKLEVERIVKENSK